MYIYSLLVTDVMYTVVTTNTVIIILARKQCGGVSCLEYGNYYYTASCMINNSIHYPY